jgi:hypothetical protein
MKGNWRNCPITSLQNYVFIGKPNSGTIALSLPLSQTYLKETLILLHLDANEFILDNLQAEQEATFLIAHSISGIIGLTNIIY